MGLFNRERSWFLSRRKFLERCHKRRGDCLRSKDNEIVVHEPLVVRVGSNIGPLIGVGPKIEQLRNAELGERLRPNPHSSGATLLHEDNLPVVKAQTQQIAVVAEVEEALSWALLLLACQERHKIKSVDMNLEGLIAGLR